MTIVYDMSTGNIESDQEPAQSGLDRQLPTPETGLQPVSELTSSDRDATPIHLIRALLDQH